MSRVAIITGSDSGIGKATAVTLAKAGCDVGVTWHTDEAGAQDTAEQVRRAGVRAEVRHLDLTKLPHAGDVIDELAEALGGLDILINNAGTMADKPFLELDLDARGGTPWTSTSRRRSCARSEPPAAWSTRAAAGGS